MVLLVLFCKRKTAYELRISDWSSDVCSSDLMGGLALLSLNWREFFAWSAVTLIFAIALWFHAHAVRSVTTLSDPVSPGWNTGGGWRFVVAAVQKATMFNLSPVAITPLLVPLSLLGWAAWRDRKSVVSG